METCNLCEGEINLAKDETVCGYGKCPKCCGGCLHHTYLNSQSPAGKKRMAYLEEKGFEYLAR
jgi:hypothetical protein